MNSSTYNDTPRLQGDRLNRSYKRSIKAQAHRQARHEIKASIKQAYQAAQEIS